MNESFELGECLLPEDHLLQKKLKKLFKNREMFRSVESVRAAGFQVSLSQKSDKIIVAGHSKLPGFLIKKFPDHIGKNVQLENYRKRIHGARKLRQFIESSGLKSIVVPQKWLYPLPDRFSDKVSREKSYVLVVEDMNICGGKGKLNGETVKRYREIPYPVLKELCFVVYHFRGLDSGPCNMTYTKSNQIAFVDTECWDEWDRPGFLDRVLCYMDEERKQFALNQFNELVCQNIKY